MSIVVFTGLSACNARPVHTKVPESDSCNAANLPSLTVDHFLEHHVLMTSIQRCPALSHLFVSTNDGLCRHALIANLTCCKRMQPNRLGRNRHKAKPAHG